MDTVEKSQGSSVTDLHVEADYHRAEAAAILGHVKDLYAEFQANKGNLTKEEVMQQIEALKELVAEAEGYVKDAELIDTQRVSAEAGAIANKAVVAGPDRNVLTSSEVAAVKSGEAAAPSMAFGGNGGS
jgi:dsDNA-specific endonuclease/ATPase MutS2